jgi:hypothetical protein
MGHHRYVGTFEILLLLDNDNTPGTVNETMPDDMAQHVMTEIQKGLKQNKAKKGNATYSPEKPTRK